MSAQAPRAFVLANTILEAPALLPELRLHLASEVLPLWQASEIALEAEGVPPPFWAFAWAGGQGLARHILDHPEIVKGRNVLDFASGSGVVAIAACMAGARHVTANDIDPFALAAITLNAAANDVGLTVISDDLVGRIDPAWAVVLAGDICYEQAPAARFFAWLQALASAGAVVLLGDPGRSYLPKTGLERVNTYAVQTTRELEDSDLRNAVVWRVLPAES
ncbi:class I SAM-dependent methyltransferase [Limibacillus halophilus]|uniref:Putative nicotinamide N-methyase n=1 Tax=Limibacillus halophilus TaxID=1579333 RepID=A0A839STZ6_9PROT|nr:methyltransferase [Limibacillus halophilus]MBB3065962.1 putative nicotinamide N-methyase [Limibacillus halophilus]